jgi:hypothetical protein
MYKFKTDEGEMESPKDEKRGMKRGRKEKKRRGRKARRK